MSRTKMKRELFFKPVFKHFAPQGGATESLTLLHEEIEAVFLMDYQGMYQEEAAQSMGVSRTTFSRIIKNARLKIATALINGKALEILDDREEFCVAFICDDSSNFGELDLQARFVVFVRLQKEKIITITALKNPLHNTKLRPGNILPALFQEHKVNYFLHHQTGEGLKSSLATRGIFVLEKEKISKEELFAIYEQI